MEIRLPIRAVTVFVAHSSPPVAFFFFVPRLSESLFFCSSFLRSSILPLLLLLVRYCLVLDVWVSGVFLVFVLGV